MNDGAPNLDARLRSLERWAQGIDSRLRDILGRLAAAEQRSLVPSGGGSYGSQRTCFFAMTPSGGIPALSGTTAPYTPGSATCEIWKYDGTHIVDAGYTATVKNGVPTVIGATQARLVQVKTIDDALWVDVDPCTWPPTS